MEKIVSIFFAFILFPLFAEIHISDVKAFSGFPWQEVVIGYTVVGSANGPLGLRAIISDNDTGDAWTNETYGAEALAEGRHQFKWNEAKVCSSNLEVKLQIFEPTYCVVDLSGGASAESYPVSYLSDIPNGGWTDEYKTTKLVLRRIEAGSFIMGEDQADETHRVTLTKSFYMGVFEVTQKQYELVTGTNPCSSTTYGRGDTYPVHHVTYDMIRGNVGGAGWPETPAVDATSFMGRIQTRTGLCFDLSTEAQWEYSCRAGTKTSYYWGDSMNDDYAWYTSNSNGKTHPVGTKKSNAWGLYDMSGNVWELNLDWYNLSLSYGTNPKGALSGTGRVDRGGSWFCDAPGCSSYYRSTHSPTAMGGKRDIGFRLALTLQDCTEAFVGAASLLTSADTTFVDGTNVNVVLPFPIAYGSVVSSGCTVAADEVERLASTESGVLKWRPNSVGEHVFVWTSDEFAMTTRVNVASIEAAKPVIEPLDGTIIGDTQSVLISCEDEDAQIHYTLDGSEPTADSPVYQRRFRVSGKTTVKAIAVFEGWTNSEVAVAHYALGQCPDPVIVSAGGERFSHKGNLVSIDWECADGVLRYTTDGSEVTEMSPEYAGAFTIDETTTIKAKAFGETYFDSQQVEMTMRYIMHTITFDSCGGSEIPSATLQEELAYRDLPVPTREGCVFLGWYTESKGGERIANDTLVDVDRTLYAHWHGISDVKVFSGSPWQEMVIGYTVVGSANGPLGLRAIISDNDTGDAWTNETYGAEALAEGRHQFKWNEAKVCSSNLEVKLQIFEPAYCVIDLSGGASASSYPVTYLSAIPNGGWTDEYKATKLVLRRVDAGSFKMQNEYDVVLTKPFYMGVFEVSQSQYRQVTGMNPSSYKGELRPVTDVSYNNIRGGSEGAKWPADNSVDALSFLGALRFKTGIGFDLPTSAQWEYACRAGTTSDYNNGGSTEDDLKLLGRYAHNRSDNIGGYSDAHTKVGSYKPNAWGLYDMHGNVYEWCLDWVWDSCSAIDPKGASSGSYRVLRSGGWFSGAGRCTSSYWAGDGEPSKGNDRVGFRLALPLQGGAEAIVEARSVLTSADTTFVDGTNVNVVLPFPIAYGSVVSSGCTVTADEVERLASTESGVLKWRPNSVGEHVFVWTSDELAMTTRVNVASIEAAKPVVEPLDGTIIGDTQSVLISCEDEDAQIHYTLDGSEPTADSPVYQRHFRVTGKTTVMAISVFEGWTNSEVAVAHYALGQCPDPVIVLAGGETFSHGSVQVSIDWECADGVLRYTTDGSDVTETSPEYAGAFTIDDTTTIKAKAFGETYFDSQQVELTVTREWESVATPIITAAESFSGRKTMVEISCATPGAEIRYSVTSAASGYSRRYVGPFWVGGSCKVEAFATLSDYANSEVATKTITKVWGIGDSVGLPDHAFTTDGDAEWVNDGGSAMRSGKITHKQTSVLRSTFVGKGRLTFELKTSCEEDLPEYMEYDRAEVWMNGALKMKQDGVHDWMPFEFDLDGASTTVEWRYVKDVADDARYPGEDCIWVRNIVWLPELTCTTEAPVELSWIREKFGDLGNYYYDYEEKAKETAANGHKVWECYVAGEDPMDKESRFTATIKMGADGKPIVSWKPPLNGEDADGAGIREGVRSYSVYGKQALDDVAEEWVPVAEGDEGDYRFFKIGVGMPEKK